MYRYLVAAAMAVAVVPPSSAADGVAAERDAESTFPRFQRFDETRETDWRQANEQVRQTGGHPGALDEGDERAPGEAPPAASHGGHHR